MEKTSFRELLKQDEKLVYTNQGDSMRPLIRQGRDLVVIEPIRGKLKKYDVPLYQRDSGEFVLHRILQIRPDGYVLCGDNRWKREYGVQDRHMIGVLTAVIRDGRELSVDDWRYRLYTHLWCDFFFIRVAVVRGRNLFRRIRRYLVKRKREREV